MRVARIGVIRLSFLAAWCLAACATPIFAQVGAGEITGIVSDLNGTAVPGATITVTNVGTNRQRIVVSYGDRVYTAPSLAPGEYRIEVELPGFKQIRREDVGSGAHTWIGPRSSSVSGWRQRPR